MRNLLLLFAMSLLLTACGGKTVEDTKYVGIPDYLMFSPEGEGEHKIQKKDALNFPMESGDHFEVSYMDMRFLDIFEGLTEDVLSNKGNELGLFVTIVAGPAEETGWKGDGEILIENRLIVSSHSKLINEKGHIFNKLIYKGIYNGGWLRFHIKVVEFDKKYFDFLKAFTSNIYNQYSNKAFGVGESQSIVSEILNSIGTSTYNSISKDDRILEIELRLVPKNYIYGDSTEHYYAQYGKMLITRVSQSSPYASKDIPIKKASLSKGKVSLGDAAGDASYVLFNITKLSK